MDRIYVACRKSTLSRHTHSRCRAFTKRDVKQLVLASRRRFVASYARGVEMMCEPREQHVVWFDGAFVPWREATMHLTAHHYGFAVFEGVRSYASDGGVAIFRLGDHTARLF